MRTKTNFVVNIVIFLSLSVMKTETTRLSRRAQKRKQYSALAIEATASL